MMSHSSREKVSPPAVNRDRSTALFARIGSYAEEIGAVWRWMRQAWGNPNSYRPGDHYMRGPGPKWREKHGQVRKASDFAQRPMVLGDKWDF
jgi:hypothetical protein